MIPQLFLGATFFLGNFRRKLLRHLAKVHPEDVAPEDPESICPLCLELFVDKTAVEMHVCQVKTKANEALQDIIAHPVDKKFHCPACLNDFPILDELKDHYMAEHVTKSITWKKLKEEREIKVETLLGNVIRTDDGNYLCDQCAFIGTKEDLTWHVKTVHVQR